MHWSSAYEYVCQTLAIAQKSDAPGICFAFHTCVKLQNDPNPEIKFALGQFFDLTDQSA